MSEIVSSLLGSRLPAHLHCDTLEQRENAAELRAALGWMGWDIACRKPSRRSALTGQREQQQGDWQRSPGQERKGHVEGIPEWAPYLKSCLGAGDSGLWTQTALTVDSLSSHFLAPTPSPPPAHSGWHHASCWESRQPSAETLKQASAGNGSFWICSYCH